MNFAEAFCHLDLEEECDDLFEKRKETYLFSSLDKMTHPMHTDLALAAHSICVCACVCVHDLVYGQRGGRGGGGRGGGGRGQEKPRHPE